jgi:hypothetical protein
MLGKLFGRNEAEKESTSEDRKQLHEIERRVTRVERGVEFLSYQLGVMVPPEEGK